MSIQSVINHLDAALVHVSKRSLHKGDNDDIWDLRFQWPLRKAELCSQLLSQTYVFSPFRVVEYQPGKYLHTFRSRDKLVLKALALALFESLPRSPLCFSYLGHGGVPGALNYVARYSSARFGLKADVADYYASISHSQLMKMLSSYIHDELLCLVYQTLSVQGAGLPRGSALSHVLGNFYLHALNLRFEHRPTQHYCRYMDDILVLATTRGALRRASATIKHQFERLGLTAAPQKSWIGSAHTRVQLQTFLGRPMGATLLKPRAVTSNGESRSR
ncbi:RNA-directed DNA polymerase [Vibrio parahaemolyticus]|nr:RNA-directed DNA polymerase [Vibrio parahaemolyticus]